MKKQDIFTIIGCVGVIGTAIAASFDTKRAFNARRSRWTSYIPTGILSVLTIGSIIASNHISSTEIAGLAGTTAYLISNRKKLEGKLRETIGNEAVDEVKQGVERHFAENAMKRHQTIEETGTGNLLCIEGYSGRVFRASKEHVDDAIKKFRQYYKHNYCCCFNDFYRFLKI